MTNRLSIDCCRIKVAIFQCRAIISLPQRGTEFDCCSLASGCANLLSPSQSPSPEIWSVVAGRERIRRRNTLGCMAGLSLALVFVADAGLLLVVQWEWGGTSD